MSKIEKILVDPNAADAVLDETQEFHRAAGSPRDAEALMDCAVDAAAIVGGHMPEVHAALARSTRPNGPVAVEVVGLNRPGPGLDIDARRLLAIGIGYPLGEPFQYAQQNGGELFPLLRPLPDAPAQSGTSRLAFGAHTDDGNMYPHLRTAHIALLAVENERRTATSFACVDRVFDMLCEESRSVLCSPLFRLGTPASHGRDQQRWTRPRPLLYRNRYGELCAQCPTYNVRAVNGDAQRALDELRSAIDACLEPRVLGPDDVSYVAFRNSRLWHSRDPVVGRRALIRTYWRPQLAALRYAGGTGNVFDLDVLRRA